MKFTIRAEKCPNRRGVGEIIRHFRGEATTFEALRGDGSVKTVLLTGGYPDPAMAGDLGGLPIVAAFSFFPGEATQGAKYVLPSAAFAEKDGTFVNHAGLAQAIRRAVKPPGEVRPELQVFADLLGRRGLVRAEDVRKEMALEVGYFAPLATGIGELGTKLG